jgi:hypothetical protein
LIWGEREIRDITKEMARLAAYEAVEVLENEHTWRFLPGTVKAFLH